MQTHAASSAVGSQLSHDRHMTRIRRPRNRGDALNGHHENRRDGLRRNLGTSALGALRRYRVPSVTGYGTQAQGTGTRVPGYLYRDPGTGSRPPDTYQYQ
eukprot:997747-Rhodomonas_salina.2